MERYFKCAICGRSFLEKNSLYITIWVEDFRNSVHQTVVTVQGHYDKLVTVQGHYDKLSGHFEDGSEYTFMPDSDVPVSYSEESLPHCSVCGTQIALGYTLREACTCPIEEVLLQVIRSSDLLRCIYLYRINHADEVITDLHSFLKCMRAKFALQCMDEEDSDEIF